MPFENLIVSTEEGVCTIALNRPTQLNALSGPLLVELLGLLGEIAGVPQVAAVVLTGAGDKAFAAGADIAEMARYSVLEARSFAELGHRVCFAIEEIDKPVIAAVHGYALGGGCELALACDFIYASSQARFGQPEVGLGLIPGFGGTQRLARRVGKARAKELVFTGDPIGADEALRIGLANAVADPAELLARAQRTARRIAARGRIAVGQAKRAIQAGEGLPLAAACEVERHAFASLFATADAREGMTAFLEKREAKFTGR